VEVCDQLAVVAREVLAAAVTVEDDPGGITSARPGITTASPNPHSLLERVKPDIWGLPSDHALTFVHKCH
jgi:hypothetical protein